MKVDIITRQAPIKKEAARCKRIWRRSNCYLRVDDWKLPQKDDNWVIIKTGGYRNGQLVVVDIDVRIPKTDKIFSLLDLPKTLTIQSQSGGLHFYYFIKKSKENDRISNSSNLLAENHKFFDLIDKIDVRGKGGIIFGPGSYFFKDKKKREYRFYEKSENSIKLIDLSLYRQIEEDLGISGEMIKEKGKSTKRINNKKIIVSQNPSKSIPDEFYGVWDAILQGDYQIRHDGQAGLEEFQIWSHLWHFIWKKSGISENQAFSLLSKNQKNFDPEETNHQLRYQVKSIHPSPKITEILYRDWERGILERLDFGLF